MTQKVVLVHTEEGFSVYCPELPGCVSQGATEEAALANITDAIRDYLEVQRELHITREQIEVDFREVQVASGMGGLPGVRHLQAIKAFEKAGFRIIRQSGHVIMSDGQHILTIPRNDPINAFTMATIVKGAGLSIDEFRKLL